MNTIDKILLGIVGFILGFTISMIVLFCIFQQTPDVLIECVFAAACSEAVVCFAIWWLKRKYGKEKINEKTNK